MTCDLGTELNSSPRLAPGIPITAICQEHAMEDSMVKVGLGLRSLILEAQADVRVYYGI